MAFTPEQEAILKAIADNPGKPIDAKNNLAFANIIGDERFAVSAGTDTGGVGVGATDRKMTFAAYKEYIESNFQGVFDVIQFNTSPPVVTTAGTILWNGAEYTIDINTGLGATIQVGQETLMLYYNDTGVAITNGQILHPKGAFDISGIVFPTPELADASKWETCEGTLAVATHPIANGALGFATRFGKVRDMDTSIFTAGQTVWVSATTPGAFTATKPSFPNYSISMGGSLDSVAAPNGTVFVTITKSVEDTYNDAWDGGIRESFDFTVSSDGAIVTGLLENVNNAKNLTLFLSDVGFYTLDTTTTPITIALTAGTDEVTTTNYIYIPIATKVLTLSTTGFPTTEHCKVSQLEVQSAATIVTELGAERNQNLNNHIKTEGDNGHIMHIAARIRAMNAEHNSGTEGSLTGTPTNGYIQVTGGDVWQLHKQVFASFSMPTRNIIISNDFVTANRRTNNLNTINAYSDGSSWNNEWSKVVIWGIINKTGEPDFVKLNLPSAGYNSEANAISDALNYANYSIPSKYKGVGFLIGAYTVRISGGTITYNGGTAYQDLRGFIPNNIAGGGGGSGITSLLGLTDVFITDYTGKAGYELLVNPGATGVDAYLKLLAGTGITNGGVSDAAQTINGVKSFDDGIKSDSIQGIAVPNAVPIGTTAAIMVMNSSSGVSGARFQVSDVQADVLYRFLNSNGDVRFQINEDGKILIPVAPAENTVSLPPLVRTSTGELKTSNQAYAALTAGVAVAYALNTGMNKTLNVAEDTTITFTEMATAAKNPSGVIVANVTVQSDIILAGTGVSFYLKGSLTALIVGRHAIAFEFVSATECWVNVGTTYDLIT